MAVFAASTLFAAQAQPTPAAAPHRATSPADKSVRRRARHTATPAKATQAEPAPAPVAPAASELPNWPANDHPAPATITWDNHGLSIEATNSTLQQILKDVETATGAKVEGMGTDQRVFGAFGPGLARDVLSQLLQGSGYNVLMIGDLGQGAPRQILLSSRNHADAQAANKPGAAAGEDDAAENDTDEQPQQPVVPQGRPAFGPGGPPRTPQQIMQEMQQRQQQMQQRPTPP